MWEYRAALDEVLDGDTIRLEVDLGFYARHRIDLRLLEVSAPELREPGGPEVRGFVVAWGEALSFLDWPLLVRTQVTKVAEPTERQTFTRYIGDAYDLASGRWLNSDLRRFLADHPDWGPGT